MSKAGAKREPVAKGAGLIGWFGEVKQEVKKVTWTSKEELILFTKVTVATTFAVGLGIYLLDLLIESGLSTVSALVKAVIS